MFHMQLNEKGAFRVVIKAKKVFVPVHAYPLQYSSFRFNIEEPAAPMTAANIQLRTIKGGRTRTVMAECNEFQIKDIALVFPYSSNTDCVSVLRISIEPWLGSIWLLHDQDRRLRGGRTSQYLGLANVTAQSLLDCLCGWSRLASILEPQRYTGSMTIQHRYSVASCRDFQVRLLQKSSNLSIHLPKNLLCFRLKFVLLSRDEGHNGPEYPYCLHQGTQRRRQPVL